MNKIEKIIFSIQSTKDFQDESLALSILERINSTPFVPDIYAFSEPLRFKYEVEDLSAPVRIWMHQEVNRNLAIYNQASGSLMMKSKSEDRVFYNFNWDKLKVNPRFNIMQFSVGSNYLMQDNNFERFLWLCKELIKIIEPVYGNITRTGEPNWKEAINVKIRLPEIRWLNIYGKPYVEMFGKEKLLSTPCHKAKAITEEIISVQASESLFQVIDDNVKNNIKNHLGKDAFVWDNKSVWGYKEGKVPNFDFSGVLYDIES
ncbi:hypothetical protein [Clostridium manihotivorum]|uniref:Uncharacterized protein n=1 Tax=Clostridium manihotivorum TaxID=2320868 RepID=A0A3R5U6E8_9CLOT|nr:hypothetical protein [Clostridium manihotivorum]QAA33036.1 hypothetical protein C1I91_16095 [Clostridium manihotivorum]